MNHDTGRTLKNPGVSGEVRDVLTEVLRQGAQQLITQAVETEVEEFLRPYRELRDEAGRRQLVRNGYLPPRTIQTGLGGVAVKAPRVRDRIGTIRFTSASASPLPGNWAGIRFFADVVMAFSTRGPQENINFLDFHVQMGVGDPEQGNREDFGGKLLKYNYRVQGYDPVSGTTQNIVPARQWMKVFLSHWMSFYRLDGIRMDSVVNFNNWDFIREAKDLSREQWMKRWNEQNPNSGGAAERFLVVGEELDMPLDLLHQNRLDSLWNEPFKRLVRDAILGGPGLSDNRFRRLVEEMIDCRNLGFRDGAQAVNYITSHDVEKFRNERLFNFLDNNRVAYKEKQIKLAFVCLLTAVGIPMILAGEEFADQHDLPPVHPQKPVSYTHLTLPTNREV